MPTAAKFQMFVSSRRQRILMALRTQAQRKLTSMRAAASRNVQSSTAFPQFGGRSSPAAAHEQRHYYSTRIPPSPNSHAGFGSKLQWKPIPVSLGLLVIAAVWYRRRLLAKEHREAPEGSQRVRPTGPWQVYVLETLPLRSISRLWGRFNEIDLPVFMRPAGYKLYSWIFGCNLEEIREKDLKKYRNLADFFYRALEEGARTIDPDALIVSPADGKVLHFGKIEGRRVEQVKGLTYSLDALLGSKTAREPQSIDFGGSESDHEDDQTKREEDFADINGITYSLDDLMSGKQGQDRGKTGRVKDASEDAADRAPQRQHSVSDEVRLAFDVGGGRDTPSQEAQELRDGNELYFTVVYLAPGDYHRFHSPTNWVVERRRHFAGELFSVSPYIAKRLANLFVLNERVVLFGRYRHGFFSMIPVGATNVGSIKIAFDRELKTNTLTKEKPEDGFVEATYRNASRLLGGQPLKAGEEMGGFSLGSTIVLVFEAPDGFQFDIEEGQKVKVGQPIGHV
ncbi:phosphatidylserine decarboxylase 1 [Savitreella phatthalungensis]